MTKPLHIKSQAEVYITSGADSMFVKQNSIPVNDALSATGGSVSSEKNAVTEFEIDTGKRFQKIDGFGASFTDSSAYLINQKLSSGARDALMVKLFDPDDGIGLSFTRQPIGSSDYARTIYSFDDMPNNESDFDLSHFSIKHDTEDIIPLLQQAKKLNPQLLIMASPWSPPAWMKTSKNMVGGSLKTDCYGVYAEYFVKYIQAYKDAGLDIYAVTPQNEPLYVPKNYPGCGMDAYAQSEFIADYLGPAFKKNGIRTKILCYDHNWDKTDYANTVLSGDAKKYVSGTAWHWYGGDASAQTKVFEKNPLTEVYFTEGSGGEWIPPFDDAFMAFMVNGIKIVNNYARSLVFWNMALDELNGPVVPNFGKTTCRGVVTVNQQTGELTYNLDYYALAHFSRFIRPGAERVFTSEAKNDIYALSCVNTDNTFVIVAANDGKMARDVRFNFGNQSFSANLGAKSAATFVMKT